jgi:integrase
MTPRYSSAASRLDSARDARIASYAPEGEEMTGHGFRSMASTLLNELGRNRDAIERQLAHGDRDSVRASYNFAEFLPERRKMMQAWADYLEQLKRIQP